MEWEQTMEFKKISSSNTLALGWHSCILLKFLGVKDNVHINFTSLYNTNTETLLSPMTSSYPDLDMHERIDPQMQSRKVLEHANGSISNSMSSLLSSSGVEGGIMPDSLTDWKNRQRVYRIEKGSRQ